jgi:hypothetical protein
VVIPHSCFSCLGCIREECYRQIHPKTSEAVESPLSRLTLLPSIADVIVVSGGMVSAETVETTETVSEGSLAEREEHSSRSSCSSTSNC